MRNMAINKWVDLSRYDLVFGLKVIQGKLLPVVEADEHSLELGNASLLKLGFHQLQDGSYAIGWGQLPTVSAWKEEFPAMRLLPLSEIASVVARNADAATAMIEKGWVSEIDVVTSFVEALRGGSLADADIDAAKAQVALGRVPEANSGQDNPDAKNSSSQSEEWPWYDLSSYGLEVIVRVENSGKSSVKVEGPSAAKHLYKSRFEAIGAIVNEASTGVLEITIPTEREAISSQLIRESFPLAKVNLINPKEITVRTSDIQEADQINLGTRMSDQAFSSLVIDRWNDGQRTFSFNDLEKYASTAMDVDQALLRPEFGISTRWLQEHLEATLVEIFNKESKKLTTQADIINLGNSLDKAMPKMTAASAESKQLQQYSTPLSISASLQSVIGISQHTTVGEPTIGNGSLVSLAVKENVYGIELSKERTAKLAGKGYRNIKEGDALNIPLTDNNLDRVIINPPFGGFANGDSKRYYHSHLEDENGNKVRIPLRKQDQMIALKHLESLKTEGVAGIILGADSPMKYKSGEYSEDTERFLGFLGDTYNIIDVHYIDGALYGSHGASWPLLMIVTGGARDTLASYTPPDILPIISNKESLINYTKVVGEDVSKYLERFDLETNLSNKNKHADDVNSNVSNSIENKIITSTPVFNNDDINADFRKDNKADSVQVKQETKANSGQEEINPFEEGDADNKTRHAVDAEEKEVPYIPRSQMLTLNKRIPANLSTPIQNSLDRVEKAYGDVDQFVCNELGWTLLELSEKLAAEQVDAVALSLSQAYLGKGIIVGDTTGIGKGRVVATMMAWAIKNDHKPIFCTSKQGLFVDIIRDLKDIGEYDLVKPFVMNDIKDIVSPRTNEVILKRSPRADLTLALASGDIPDKYNAVFMTYSQANLDIGKSKKAQWLQKVSVDNILLFDEIHNASGPDSNTGANFLDAIRGARFTLGSSATYAKRPDNLGLYIFTSMFDANDPKSVIESITLGGPEYQEVLSTMLAESGQLITRAHQPPPPPEAVIVNPTYAEGYDSIEFTDRLARVLDAMTAIAEVGEQIVNRENEAIKELKKRLPKEQQGSYSGWRSQSLNFGSQVNHIVRVANYAAKADSIVEQVIEAVDEGRRPVVAVEGTMQTFLMSAYTTELEKRNSLRELEAIQNEMPIADVPVDTSPITAHLTYRDTILKYLNKMMIIKRTDKYGNETSDYIVDALKYEASFKDGELEVALTEDIKNNIITSENAETVRYYYYVVSLIDQLPTSLPASPIDYVQQKLKERGIKIGELTGRDLGLDYATVPPTFRNRSAAEKDRIKVADDFNNGDTGGLIFNSAAAEGVSLHAHQDFVNNENRRMIFWQIPGDINVYTQMGGRIQRSGSVKGASPDYRVVCLDTAADHRAMANLEKNEGSLKANVKADRQTGISMASEPMMNRVGDLVTLEVLTMHPQSDMLCKRLSIDLESEKFRFSVSGIENRTGSNTGLFSKLTGRLCRMQNADCKPLLELLEEGYRSRIEMLDAKGSNPLKTQIHDFKCELNERSELFPRSGPSAFEAEVYVQTISYQENVEPVTANYVNSEISNARNHLESYNCETDYPIQSVWDRIKARLDETLLTELTHNAPKYLASLPGSESDKIEFSKLRIRDHVGFIHSKEQIQERLKGIVKRSDLFEKLRDQLGLGVLVQNVPIGSIKYDSEVTHSDMVVTRVNPPFPDDNQALPGKWSINLSSPNAYVGNISVSLNQFMGMILNEPKMKLQNEQLTSLELSKLFNDNRDPMVYTQERKILMGNLPLAYKMSSENSNFSKGKPGVFTTADGRKLRGIVMGKHFSDYDLKLMMEADFSISNVDVAQAFFEKMIASSRHPIVHTSPSFMMAEWAKRNDKPFTPGRGVMFRKDTDTYQWKLEISAIKKNSSPFIGDMLLNELLDGPWVTPSHSNKLLEATISEDNIDKILNRLMTSHGQTIHSEGIHADWYREFMRERGNRLVKEQADSDRKKAKGSENCDSNNDLSLAPITTEVNNEPAPAM